MPTCSIFLLHINSLDTFKFSVIITSSKSTVLLCSVPFLWNCCTILALLISSEIIDGFWHKRCLNDCINLFYIIGSFASGTNVSLVAKRGTIQIIPLLLIKSSPVDWFLCLRCLNNRIDLPDMIRLLASGAINCLVAKIGTKDIAKSCRVHFHSKAGGRRPIAGPEWPPAGSKGPKPSAGARRRGTLLPRTF